MRLIRWSLQAVVVAAVSQQIAMAGREAQQVARAVAAIPGLAARLAVWVALAGLILMEQARPLAAAAALGALGTMGAPAMGKTHLAAPRLVLAEAVGLLGLSGARMGNIPLAEVLAGAMAAVAAGPAVVLPVSMGAMAALVAVAPQVAQVVAVAAAAMAAAVAVVVATAMACIAAAVAAQAI